MFINLLVRLPCVAFGFEVKGAAVGFVLKYFLVIAFIGLWGTFWLITFYFILR